LTDDVESLAVGVTADFLVIHDGAHGHVIELAYNTPKANRLKQEFSLEQKIRTGEPTLVLVKKAKRILGKDLLGLDCVFGTRPVYVPHYHLDARLNPEALEGTLIAVVLKPQRATSDGKPKYTSIKASQTEAAEKLNKAAFNKLRIGATTTGTITASTPLGYTLELVTKVLVDGYAFTLEALLPREEVTDEEVQMGDSVAVKVTNIDWSSRAILVSQKRFVSELRKEMQAHSFGELQLNKTYGGKVVEIIPSGAKVRLANGFVALLPNGEGEGIGEMKVDDELTGLLLFKLDEVKQRAYLSQKRVFVGEVLQGTIQQIEPKEGVRLTLKGHVTALLPAEALSNPEQVLHSGYQLNQKPWVEVVSIDGGVVIVKRAGQNAVKRAKGKSTKRVKKPSEEAAA
jgi:ribosomal protein S1